MDTTSLLSPDELVAELQRVFAVEPLKVPTQRNTCEYNHLLECA